MRVVILHNAVSPTAGPDERDVLVQRDAVAAALVGLGHQPEAIPCTLDLESLRRQLLDAPPDVVFNLVESLAGFDWLAHLVPAVLDVLHIPYTGSSTRALFLTNDKILAKERLSHAGLRTPGWVAVAPDGRVGWWLEASLPSRYMIKAVTQHASFGIGEHSVIEADTPHQLIPRLREYTAKHHTACFAEQYVEGREFNLSLLAGPAGPQVLPPAEIDFSAFPEGKLRIVDYRAKWAEDSFEYHHTPRRFDFPPSDQPLVEDLCRLARECWDVFGLGGYARVDFRVDLQGHPWILEINANPCLSPDAGFAAALAQAGMGYEEAIGHVVRHAVGSRGEG